jgi:hypothetical protein
MTVVSDALPQSDYTFSIYYWRYHGAREDQCLKVIAETDIIAGHIEQLLKEAVDNTIVNISDIGNEKWKSLDDNHYIIWNAVKNEHIEQNKRIIQFQRESLSTSHKARMALLEDRLKNSENEKIAKMWQGSITKAASDYTRHIQDLELAETKADIEFEPVAYGVMRVRGGK